MADSFFLAPGKLPAPADFSAKADALLHGFLAAELFAGSVLVASGRDIVLRQGFGLADHEWGTPHGPDGKFRTGSLTKQFTAAAILQLMETRALTLEEPIATYYAGAPVHWQAVSLFHLLTHTSGIPSYTSLPGFFDAAARLDHSPEALIALTRDAPLAFPPGSQFKYNNGGYVILGHVIETITGRRYEDYLVENILRPLGLTNTGYEHTETILPLRARGYRFVEGRIENAAPLAMSVPYAAGSIYSTADDLLAWLHALKRARPISEDSVALMIGDHGHGYGMGFAAQSQFGHRHLVHAGGINGFSVVLSHYPDLDLTVIVLANLQGAPVQKIARDLTALYLGIDQAEQEMRLDPALLADYVGTYRLGAAKLLKVSQDGARLFVDWAGQRQEAVARDDHHFAGRWGDWSLTFEADGVALASRAVFIENGRSWSGPRLSEEAQSEEVQPSTPVA